MTNTGADRSRGRGCVNASVGQPHHGMPAGSDPKQALESLQCSFLV